MLISTLGYLRDPYRTLLAGARRYGDPFRLPSFLGPLVVTGDPEAAKTIFGTDPDAFAAIGADLLGPVLGEHNLILLSGEQHRAMRKLQAPPFHGARMHAYGQLILRVAEQQTARWPQQGSFDIYPTMQAISLEVILQAVLGLSDPQDRRTFQEAVVQVVGALKPSFMFFRGLRRPLAGLSAWARFQRKSARITSLFSEHVSRRRADPRPREDILSLFMAARYDDGSALDDTTLLQQIMNLIGAGHETTASSLSFRPPPHPPRPGGEAASARGTPVWPPEPGTGRPAPLSGGGLSRDAAPRPGRPDDRAHPAAKHDPEGVRTPRRHLRRHRRHQRPSRPRPLPRPGALPPGALPGGPPSPHRCTSRSGAGPGAAWARPLLCTR